MIKTITAAELINGRTFDRTIIDIRPAEEYKKGSMDAALNIPEDKLVEYLENPEEADLESGTIGDGKAWEEGVNVGKLLAAIPKDKPVWVLCHTGNKSLYVAELMSDAGFDAGSVEGGYRSFLRLSLSMMVMNEEEVTERTKAIERSIITKYRKSIWRRFTKGVHDYELIKEGDKIAVCISGGKDSMLMAKLLQELQLHGKVKFDLVFLVMNPGYNEDNWNIILNNAKLLGIPINVFESDIFNIVADVDKSPCYLCARMRRGYLYSHAKELGCNKIALGHHFDDVIETTLMGMLYSGKVETMMPKLHSKNFEGMELIRPMYMVREADIKAWIWCIDGDGSALMHMGAMAIIGSTAPANMIHVIINNEAHETVGGMPTAASVNFTKVAKACGYPHAVCVDTFDDLERELKKARKRKKLSLIEVKCAIGSRQNLGRPTTTAIENKEKFMEYLKTLNEYQLITTSLKRD